MASFTIIASDGTLLPIDSLEQTFTYNGDFVETITVEYADKTFVQSFTNNGTAITSVSGWVLQ